MMMTYIIMGLLMAALLSALIVEVEGGVGEAYAQTRTTDEGGGSASAGGLSASIAKDNYNAGDTVVINGTVAEYTPTSIVIIEVIDPEERVVEEGRPHVSGGKFRFTFTAGENVQFDPNHWMLLSGDYTVEVRYTPPSIGTSPAREQVELHFNYNNGATSTATPNANQEQQAPPPSSSASPPEQQQQQNMTITPPAAEDLNTTTTTNNATTTNATTTDTTTAGGGSSSGTSTGSSTYSSSSSPSSSGSSRCPDGYHRSPSGDCERVTDTRGMPRCPDGYHRSPSGNCEYVG